MGIVVIDVGAVVAALQLHASACAGKARQGPADQIWLDAIKNADCCGGQGVHGVMPAHQTELHMAIELIVIQNVELLIIF